MTKSEFIEKIAGYVCEYAPKYNIFCPSAVIAQAILESGWGLSVLADKYHNYFGLKCGTLWKGKSVNLATKEEYEPGIITDISDDFRVYDSMEEGVKGYFEFIQLSRYKNLQGITDYKEYLQTIKSDGYATSSDYVVNTCRVVEQNDLTKYDPAEYVVTASMIIDIMRGWLGLSKSAGTHKVIIDIYNGHMPLARNYKVTYTDEYCDTTVSAAFIKAGNVDIIGGTECGVEEHVKKFQKAGIWIEDGTITPLPGDIIVFNWDTFTQPNDGWSDHIGIVESVSNGQIITIEGNINGGMVARRSIDLGWGYIRGFARPRYGETAENKPEATTFEEKKVSKQEVVKAKKCTVTVPYIRKGNVGAMVEILQHALNMLANAGLDVDGEFGSETDKALKDYQTSSGITASGLCGAGTFRRIIADIGASTYDG